MRLHAILLLAIVLVCNACAGRATPQPATAQFAGLPFPVDRAISGLTLTRQGTDTDARSNGATQQGNSLLLSAGANGIEYAIYRFTPTDDPTTVEFTLDSAVSAGAFLGLANFQQQRWVFDGPIGTPSSLMVNPQLHVSPLGNVFVAVAVGPGASAKIDLVALLTSGNAPPTASFTSAPLGGGPAPLDAQFDASASSDPDGSIARYEWDFDNDGSFETDMGAVPTAQHHFDLPGEYPVTLRVTDNANASATVQQMVTAHGWLVVSVSPASAYTPVLVVTAGCPAIGWWDGSNLNYARASTVRGTAAADWQQITALPSAGSYLAFAAIGGHPAASFTSYIPSITLRYVRSTTATGLDPLDWSQLATVDPGLPGAAGFLSSLAEVNGSPAIAYNEIVEAKLRYARATSADGAQTADWTQLALVDAAVAGGYAPSLCVVDGDPAIAYRNQGALGYARALTPDGALAGDWTQLVAPAPGSNAAYPTLCIVAGKPAIGYEDVQTKTLSYTRSSTTAGALAADWSTLLTLLPTGGQEGLPWLAVVGNRPAMAYYDQNDNHLKFEGSTTADGAQLADWSDQSTIKSATNGGKELSLAEVDGHAAVAFAMDSIGADSGVHYAILF